MVRESSIRMHELLRNVRVGDPMRVRAMRSRHGHELHTRMHEEVAVDGEEDVAVDADQGGLGLDDRDLGDLGRDDPGLGGVDRDLGREPIAQLLGQRKKNRFDLQEQNLPRATLVRRSRLRNLRSHLYSRMQVPT